VDLYSKYFADLHPAPPLHVGARAFPITITYLETLHTRFPQARHRETWIAEAAKACGKLGGTKLSDSAVGVLVKKQRVLAACIARWLYTSAKGSSVLVFVPGMDDIEEIFEAPSSSLAFPHTPHPSQMFEQDKEQGHFRCLAIHSDLPFEEQLAAWTPAEPHELKVIIATNAAESSITLPDVDHVICLGPIE
jgi:HrpA-like RNA helicase